MAFDCDIRELSDSRDEKSLAQLIAIHSDSFPTHTHVIAELRENAALPLHRDNVVVHQLLAVVDGVPAGIAVVHSNLNYRVGLIHFLAVVPQFRGRDIDGKRMSTRLVECAVDLVYADIDQSQVAGSFVGVVAESDPGLISSWEAWGFRPLPIPYREPFFGKHWRDHLPLDFFDMTLVGLTARDNTDELARAGAAAFLLDHYRLPVDHEVVRAAINE